MTVHTLQREQVVPRPPDEVFPFFADAGNLDVLTPAWLRFEILTPLPVEMRVGRRLDYRLRWHGVPLRWRTEIEVWEPGVRFVDRQVRGPYALWQHTHDFAAVDGGTRIADTVRYALRCGALGRAAHVLSVRRDVQAIFDYRANRIAELFGD